MIHFLLNVYTQSKSVFGNEGKTLFKSKNNILLQGSERRPETHFSFLKKLGNIIQSVTNYGKFE